MWAFAFGGLLHRASKAMVDSVYTGVSRGSSLSPPRLSAVGATSQSPRSCTLSHYGPQRAIGAALPSAAIPPSALHRTCIGRLAPFCVELACSVDNRGPGPDVPGPIKRASSSTEATGLTHSAAFRAPKAAPRCLEYPQASSKRELLEPFLHLIHHTTPLGNYF
ncbi:hypothetical protein HBH56_184430 [Parastagonospora nodorum]|nr:hypothetical protein HBH56_184430 [Parastagonospora nodorum]KAH3926155.1 hypothetical protein HBH54_173580 [Parastagonospora nodorum]KAH3962518.1 hypothetical protein HBH52_225050 [Parastagonospora nodorum]KAH4047128.1 hypothetical protein HBH49_177810 [Parastagonospora nodorum]KAH4100793.1 hypothetical protein HBH46_148090 [Parastagonospora nodorum]